jgi:hypothetical protein
LQFPEREQLPEARNNAGHDEVRQTHSVEFQRTYVPAVERDTSRQINDVVTLTVRRLRVIP